MLPLGGETVILCDDGPAVGKLADGGLAGVDHGLYRERHSGLKAGPRAGPTVVQYLRLLVKIPADPVAAKLANHAVAVPFGVPLDRRADIAEELAKFGRAGVPLVTSARLDKVRPKVVLWFCMAASIGRGRGRFQV